MASIFNRVLDPICLKAFQTQLATVAYTAGQSSLDRIITTVGPWHNPQWIMGHKAGAMAHEYKGEHADGAEHSKEYYEKKYGKYEHKKQGMQEEGNKMYPASRVGN